MGEAKRRKALDPTYGQRKPYWTKELVERAVQEAVRLGRTSVWLFAATEQDLEDLNAATAGERYPIPVHACVGNPPDTEDA